MIFDIKLNTNIVPATYINYSLEYSYFIEVHVYVAYDIRARI